MSDVTPSVGEVSPDLIERMPHQGPVGFERYSNIKAENDSLEIIQSTQPPCILPPHHQTHLCSSNLLILEHLFLNYASV